LPFPQLTGRKNPDADAHKTTGLKETDHLCPRQRIQKYTIAKNRKRIAVRLAKQGCFTTACRDESPEMPKVDRYWIADLTVFSQHF
jgi:hypothetical protein